MPARSVLRHLRLPLFVLFLSISVLSCKKTSLNTASLGFGRGGGGSSGGGSDTGGSVGESSACQSLQPGQICTFLGAINIGQGSDPSADGSKFSVSIGQMAEDGSGNLFFMDTANNVIWFWNRSGIAVLVLGVSVAPNTASVVAGNGDATASTTNGVSALSTGLGNSIFGMTFDSVSGNLYFSSYLAGLVRRIDSSGTISTILGGGASHTDATAGTSHQCFSPLGLSMLGTSLYVACSSSHRIKQIDLNTGLAYTFLGTGAAANSGDGVAVASAQVLYPSSIAARAEGIYYTTGTTIGNAYLLRFANLGGSTNIGGIAVSANAIKTLVGATSGCMASGVDSLPSVHNLSAISAFSIQTDRILIFDGCAGGGIHYFNISATTSPTLGGSQTVATGKVRRLNQNFAGLQTGVGIHLARLSTSGLASSLVFDSVQNEYIFSEYNNGRVQTIDPTNNWYVTPLISPNFGRDYSNAGSDFKLSEARAGSLGDLVFDTVRNRFLFVDGKANRIRSIESDGTVKTVLGRGDYTYSGVPDQLPLSADIYVLPNPSLPLRGLEVDSNGGLHYVNQFHHVLRTWNMGTTSQSFFGRTILSGRVSDVSGLSGSFADLLSGATLATASFSYPQGIAIDTSSGLVWIVDSNNHKIKGLDSSGSIVATYGGSNGGSGINSGLLTALQFSSPSDVIALPNGNLIVSDFGNSRIRYLNRSGSAVTVAGVSIPANSHQTIVCNSGVGGVSTEGTLATLQRCGNPAGLAYLEDRNWICFANFSSALSNVRCLDLATGLGSTIAGPTLSVSTGARSLIDSSQEGLTALNARFDQPLALARKDEFLYIVDYGNSAIRKLRLPSSL